VTRLSEFDKAEWLDVARKLRPDWSVGDFEAEWAAFQRAKAKRMLQ
jgi:hypothetical protein